MNSTLLDDFPPWQPIDQPSVTDHNPAHCLKVRRVKAFFIDHV